MYSFGGYEKNVFSNIYDAGYTDQIKLNKNSFYEKQKKRAIDFVNQNVATPYSRSIVNSKCDTSTMGPVTNNFAPEKGFEAQFDLYKFNNKDIPLATNENNRNDIIDPNTDGKWSNVNNTDMTYGVVDKENFIFENMVPFTSRRDKIIDDHNPYISRTLGIFTGVRNQPLDNKKEVEAFFSPENSKRLPSIDAVNSDIRDRYVTSVGIKQNNTKPFESVQISSGEKELQKNGLFYEDIRILPDSIDKTRSANNQQISYTPQINPGKLGDKFKLGLPQKVQGALENTHFLGIYIGDAISSIIPATDSHNVKTARTRF